MANVILLTTSSNLVHIQTAINRRQPNHVFFFTSDEYIDRIQDIQANIEASRKNCTTTLIPLEQPDDLNACYAEISEQIQQLQETQQDLELYADYSGGTPSMTLGLALAAIEHDVALQAYSARAWETILHNQVPQLQKRLKTDTQAIQKFFESPGLVKSLTLGNFKAFANTQRIPIRPITLIYGPNSSGKSSIIHSLLLARHAFETGELDAYTTTIGGDAVDLGGFGQYVYKRDRRKLVEWGLELDPKQFPTRLNEFLKPIKTLTVSITIGLDAGQVRVQSFSIEGDREEIIYMSARQGGEILRCDRLNYDHPIIAQIIDAIVATQTTATELTEADREAIESAINELAPEITAQVLNWLPPGIEIADDDKYTTQKRRWKIPKAALASITAADTAALGRAFGREGIVGGLADSTAALFGAGMLPIGSGGSGDRQQDLVTILQFWLVRRLHDLILGISQTVESDFKRLRYLGPFRSYPPRHFGAARQQDSNWEAGGGAAWQTLLTNTKVREKVNFWLSNPERMKTPYQLVLRDFIPGSDLATEMLPLLNEAFQKLAVKLIAHASGFGAEIQSEIERLMGDIESLSAPDRPAHTLPEIEELISILLDTEDVSDEWVKHLATSSSERTVDLVLVDQRSQTPVSHRDVGIGVSQVLPILVSCYALENSKVAVEQPELHLHPRLQSELADVFIESALGGQKNTFILETHSEHLLLRIMRRMRETYNKTLPEGCLPVTPDDICVLYVDPVGPSSIVQEMPLNKRGELVKAWPGGFFEEGLEEVFA
ncbi:AAA family ATPase [Leptolyngbya sp. FACHB-711]|uniref:AAA family ATPase n=1 Tax=Leptolyngbya sp. FACHB-711 TaxID=2692813 RepID=UPI0016828E8A|nr:AAA family ATPase [Leptolyngbya sp. FACHB-711]MBD2028232.1 AAA family ATPase [Leptolyngbya sp. FACHB-711]